MKPHPRIRKTSKWGGLWPSLTSWLFRWGMGAAAAVFLLLWVYTAFGGAWYLARGSFLIQLNWGCVIFDEERGLSPPPDIVDGFSTRLYGVGGAVGRFRSFIWRWNHVRAGPVFGSFASRTFVPLWIPFIATAMCCGVAWRLDTLARRRARLNLCPKCNYDRTGLASGAVCPECGTL